MNGQILSQMYTVSRAKSRLLFYMLAELELGRQILAKKKIYSPHKI